MFLERVPTGKTAGKTGTAVYSSNKISRAKKSYPAGNTRNAVKKKTGETSKTETADSESNKKTDETTAKERKESADAEEVTTARATFEGNRLNKKTAG